MIAQANDRQLGWFTRKEAAAFVGVREPNFDQNIRAYLPADAVQRGDRRRVWIWGPAIIALLTEREREKAKSASSNGDGDPLMVDGSDSPALERYRLARARIEELNYETRRGKYIPVDQLQQGWHAMANILRDAVARLRRQYGNEAGDLIDEALDDAEQTISETLTQPHDHENSVQSDL